MYEYKCKITKIVDGDTLDVDIDLGFDIILRNQRIRLYGVDTPELRTTNNEEKVFGFLAKDFVEKFVDKGDILLRTHDYNPKGKFGRIIADIVVNGNSLSEFLIENYLGVAYFGQSKELIEEKHLENRKILYESGVVKRQP